MNNEWQVFAVYCDAASAEATAGRLRAEQVPVRIVTNQPVPGLTHEVRLLIPAYLAHRAQWVLAQAQFTDEELAACALSQVDASSEEL